MKLVQVLHGWPPATMGGTGLYVRALAGGLRAEGHTVLIAHPGPPGPPGVTAAGEQVTLTGPAPRRWAESWRHAPARAAWRRWLQRTGADVVHVHHLSGLPLGLIAASRDAGARVVLTLHDYALPCARGQLVDRDLRPCPGPSAQRCARCVAEQLRLDPVTAAAGRFLARWPALRRRTRDAAAALPPRPRDTARILARLDAVAAAISAADVLLSPSHDLAERIALLGLPRPRHCPLPLTRPIPAAPPAPPGPVRFLFASSVIPTKGPHLLLEAFSQLPAGTATLTIAGHTPDFDAWPGFGAQLQARAAAIDGVTWRGALPPEDIPALLAAHDTLVLPSLWPENSPLVLREATAAGLSVIASTTGGSRELAPHARLVAPGDTAALTHALRDTAAAGRKRQPAAQWQSPQEHARWVLREAYSH